MATQGCDQSADQRPEWRGDSCRPNTPTMSREQTREEVVERWMLAAVRDGGVERFDDLHVDRIEAQWKERKAWVSAGLDAYRVAVVLRDRHQLPFVVTLGFSLESGERLPDMGLKTMEELTGRLDWSPPSLYLFHPGRTPCSEATRAIAEKVVEDSVVIQELNPAMFGVEVSAARAYYMVFRPTGSSEATSSLFIEG
jgi:hypothetical protein